MPRSQQIATVRVDLERGDIASGDFYQEIDREDLWTRIQSPGSATPRPFLKWAGSKRHALRHVFDTLPTRFRTYREPFLGSGALFFLLRPKHAVLSDTCAELIHAFIGVRENVGAIARCLRLLRPNRKTFYEVRSSRSTGFYKAAAEFVYLNKTCWNGLYRVNSAGEFNVPFGRPGTGEIVDFRNLRACAKALQSLDINIRVCDFEENTKDAEAGDLVYLDPPYVTGHTDNGFIEYNEVLFSWQDQQRLARTARRLDQKGVHVIVSNADHPKITELYEGFAVKQFRRSSTLASDVSKRRQVSEVLIFSSESKCL